MNEFRNSLHEYSENTEDATLEGYLENVALVTDLDREENGGSSYVTMMTLHSAKGLEFDNVFIPGMEENLFPSIRSMTDENRLEEERRLMYVGITRARVRLYLSYASERMMYNQYNHNAPSRFLEEIPGRLTETASFEGRREPSFLRREHPGTAVRRQEETTYPINRKTGTVSSTVPGKPKLTFKGLSLDQIPGVSKGFVPSAAREVQASAMQGLFHEGDRVRHPKFGTGTVLAVSGSGKEARIRIRFEDRGEKELALAIAPIVKMEEEA